ncbi:type II secretion system secretin GspD [Aquisalinus flavus]|uniref:Type II secretion system protein GspD n=1 Tax=Aquisalinus flavus TaxID=1526572 RepID=A0A8J2V148_9PROT|nr:type II secretion system secretin GspD [Aquisalinus flavus]MBD0427319.1 type II secretion system secretin GspD [Aquisalinus flavus]UNE47125.1 type II secretion system protein GspD [Aquisalinus flavus]GGD00075.1 type II secretion system protein GspD [Aquisalinus flavus]
MFVSRLIALASLGMIAGLSLAPAPANALQAGAQQGASINYDGADIRDFIESVSLRTGRSFVIDPRLQGQVTIFSPPDAALTSDEIWELFLATMQVNGYVVLPITDNEYKIVPGDQTTRAGGTGPADSGGEIVTRILRLDNVDARTAATTLRGLHSERGLVTPVPESNSVVIVDTATNVERLVEVARDFDRDTSIVRSIRLQSAIATEVATTLRDLLAGAATETRRGNATSVVAVPASNTVILRGTPADISRLVPLVEELDRNGASQVDLTVVYLNHANAEEIVPLLTEMIATSYGSETATRKPSIAAHKETNALIISADPDTRRLIQQVIAQLDIRRPQVMIEAIIVEISDTLARDLGLQYVVGGEDMPFSSTRFNQNSPNLLAGVGAAYLYNNRETQTVTDADNNTTTTTTELIPGTEELIDAAIGSLLGVSGFSLGGGGVTDDGTLFAAILTAVQNDTQSNILSTPFAVTLDNQTARLSVGQEIPVTTGEAVGNDLENAFRQVERQEIGVILEVTPQINEGNTVRMQIIQEVSSVNGALTQANRDFVTNKSVVETTAVAEDGEVLILGGLIDDNSQLSESKVPLLGDIPIAGNLFKGTSRTNRKSTLMVFIKPTILRDRRTSEAVTARKYNYARQQQLLKTDGEVPPIDILIEDFLGAAPAGVTSPVIEE